MANDIHDLGEEIKKELEKLEQNESFRGIAAAIRRRFPKFRKEKIQFNLEFDAVVWSSKEIKPKVMLRFPLASLSTGTTFPSTVHEDPEEEKTLKKWEQGCSVARYTVDFGLAPSFAKKKIQVCPHCEGVGIKLLD